VIELARGAEKPLQQSASAPGQANDDAGNLDLLLERSGIALHIVHPAQAQRQTVDKRPDRRLVVREQACLGIDHIDDL
jgi:hypothetical protein